MKGLRTPFLPQTPSPTMMNRRLTRAGNEKRWNKRHRHRTNPIYNLSRKNRRFGVSPSPQCYFRSKTVRPGTPTAAGSGAFSSDGAGPAATYAERELEMQRLLMGKCRTKMLKGVEVVKGEGDGDGGDGDDEEGGDRPARSTGKAYKPREYYKWRAESPPTSFDRSYTHPWARLLPRLPMSR